MPARPGAASNPPEVAREIEDLRATPFVEYERVSALKLRFLKLAFAQFLREWRSGGRTGARVSSLPRTRGRPARDFRHLLRAGRRAAPHAIPISGCGPIGRRPTRTPARPKRSPSAGNTGGASCSTSTCSGRSTCNWRRRSNGRATGTFPSASITTWRWPPTASAATCGRTGRSTWRAAAWVRRPTISLPRARTGPFRRPTRGSHREDGYRLFAESIRKNCRHGGALRIDHVMRLFRLFWIPDGVEATEGAYVRERSEDFVRILALESVRNRVVVVGEDLGTVEPAIRETLARFGILSYRLFYFEKNEAGEFRRATNIRGRRWSLPPRTICPPWPASGWPPTLTRAAPPASSTTKCSARSWNSAGREKQKMLDVLFQLNLVREDLPRSAEAYPELTGELHNAIVGFLAMTPSQLLAINQEDLTKEVHQQNLPGSTWQYPNWGRKMRFTIEQLRGDATTRGYTTMFHHWIERSGRRNQWG